MRPGTFRAWVLVVTLAPVLLVVGATSQASACPFCDGGPSGESPVRDGIFDDHFWPRAAATLAPFPILAALVALIYFGPPGFARRQRGPGAARGLASSSQVDSPPGGQAPQTGDLSCTRRDNSIAAR